MLLLEVYNGSNNGLACSPTVAAQLAHVRRRATVTSRYCDALRPTHYTAIGERSYDWIDDEAKSWLRGYQQIASVTDEGALEWAVREAQSRMWMDRLEATVEAHILPAAHVRERCTIPGISARTAYFCRDNLLSHFL
jgi:hypothetical protein